MIRTFADRDTETLLNGTRPKKCPAEIFKRAYAKVLALHSAKSLADLLVPPGNRLERLGGDRDGQYSIRVNDQWRVVFTWKEDTQAATDAMHALGNAYDTEFVDYH